MSRKQFAFIAAQAQEAAPAGDFNAMKAIFDKQQITEGTPANSNIISPMVRCWMQTDSNKMNKQYCHDLVLGEDLVYFKTFTPTGFLLSEEYGSKEGIQLKNNLEDAFSFDKFIAKPLQGAGDVNSMDFWLRLTHEGVNISEEADLVAVNGRISRIKGGTGTEVAKGKEGPLTVLKADFTEATILEVYATLRPIRDNLCVTQLYRFPENKEGGSKRRFSRRFNRNTQAKEKCKTFDQVTQESGQLEQITKAVKV